MGFKQRGYRKSEQKLRDYSLFAIACEGSTREPEYFSPFDSTNRIKVDIITRDENDDKDNQFRSSPSYVRQKIEDYVRKYDLDSEMDSLWCVIDVDRWTQRQIDDLYDFCRGKANRHIIISNPCFEIWLLYHKKKSLEDLEIRTAQDAKKLLHEIGQYYYVKYIPDMPSAIVNAKAADCLSDSYMPEIKTTKVYKLAEALLNHLGNNGFMRVLDNMLANEKEKLCTKYRQP